MKIFNLELINIHTIIVCIAEISHLVFISFYLSLDCRGYLFLIEVSLLLYVIDCGRLEQQVIILHHQMVEFWVVCGKTIIVLQMAKKILSLYELLLLKVLLVFQLRKSLILLTLRRVLYLFLNLIFRNLEFKIKLLFLIFFRLITAVVLFRILLLVLRGI